MESKMTEEAFVAPISEWWVKWLGISDGDSTPYFSFTLSNGVEAEILWDTLSFNSPNKIYRSVFSEKVRQKYNELSKELIVSELKWKNKP